MRAVRIATLGILWGLVLALGAFVLPDAAFADVQTIQALPPGGNTCAPLAVSGFTPYVYEDGMHSFDFYVSDASYVAVAGLVGENPVPFYYVSRRQMDGRLRVHVDLPTTNVSAGAPVHITMLSIAAPGLPTCLSTFSTIVSRQTPPAQTPQVPNTKPTPTATPVTSPQTTPKPVSDAPGTEESAGEEKDPITDAEGEGAVKNPIVAAFSTLGQVVASMCAASETAKRLWAFLVAIFALIMVGVVFGTLPSIPRVDPVHLKLAAIAVPLLLFAGLWYFAETCRSGLWPLAALLILSGAAAFGVLQDRQWVQSVIQLPSSTSSRDQI